MSWQKKILISLCFVHCVAISETIYQATATDGVVIFSDKPIPDTTQQKTFTITIHDPQTIKSSLPTTVVTNSDIPKSPAPTNIVAVNNEVTPEPLLIQPSQTTNESIAEQLNNHYYNKAHYRKIIIEAYQNLDDRKNELRETLDKYRIIKNKFDALPPNSPQTIQQLKSQMDALLQMINADKIKVANAKADVTLAEDKYSRVSS